MLASFVGVAHLLCVGMSSTPALESNQTRSVTVRPCRVHAGGHKVVSGVWTYLFALLLVSGYATFACSQQCHLANIAAAVLGVVDASSAELKPSLWALL
jgi:hypothetical protein